MIRMLSMINGIANRKYTIESGVLLIGDAEFIEGGGASKCPGIAEMLSGYFRNWCPDVSEIGIRNCLITEQTANAVRPQLSVKRLVMAEGGGADE